MPSDFQALPRRRRTPSSIGYRPPPLRFVLPAVTLELPEVGEQAVHPEATVFDFAAVSVGLQVPFRMPAPALSQLAGWLAEPAPLVRLAREVLAPLHEKLLPAVENPYWQSDLSEEYFVFQLPPGAPFTPSLLLEEYGRWLAGLLRLEAGPLSADETAEALRLHLSYSPDDLFVPDWGAAVLLDRDCEETLQTIEFTNLQLLEFRHIDNRLDDNLETAYSLIRSVTRSRLPLWRTHSQNLRMLGELKVVANEVFERSGNVLKLVGDPYLARIYRQLVVRFGLREWERSIQRKLEVIEGVYQVLSDQAATSRAELLELIVVVLILLEIVLAIWRH